jgi:predicted transcriptional regulator
MKAIMQSIHPYWIVRILEGKKTRELRKSRPRNIEYPFKVYMYETKKGIGAVVGEYVCHGIVTTSSPLLAAENSGIPYEVVSQYMGNGKLCCWDISGVKKYKTPVPITQFGLKKAPQSWCYVDCTV